MKKIFTGPFTPRISLRLLKEQFDALSNSENPAERTQAKQALDLLAQTPSLLSGGSFTDFQKKASVVNQIMAYLFPAVLTSNEIKAAVSPFMNTPFYMSKRLQEILAQSNEDVAQVFSNLFIEKEGFDLTPYAIILNKYYHFNVDFFRPYVLKIDNQSGLTKTYRAAFNADFLNIYPNKNAIEITKEILDDLLANATNKAVWNQYFPENSWTLEGFGVISLIDVSLDDKIEQFKTHLIQPRNENFSSLLEDIRSIFGIENLELGSFAVENNKLQPPNDKSFKMLSFQDDDELTPQNYACERIYQQLFKKHQPVALANVEHYKKESKNNRLSKILIKKGFKSAALIPVVIQGKLRYVIELGTYVVNQINAINLVKVETLMPFILSYSRRSITENENEISAIIQRECTSIHPAVQWRFQEEASNYIHQKTRKKTAVFNEIVFEDLLPLYGQIDIIDSSKARNHAIQKDLEKQLLMSRTILEQLLQRKVRPFYEQLAYQINTYLESLKSDFQANTEQEISRFFNKQITPLFEHLLETKTIDTKRIETFFQSFTQKTRSYYEARKDYDNSVTLINKRLSDFLDQKQVEAQTMFPHYFEKFKTDGIEHNMYVGQSISKNIPFHRTDLYNLRLWQLQVVCEMETMYYKTQKNLPLELNVASLILAYDVPITIRYRIDEKRFDVDGAYNARYEMIKKRIDKALIRGSQKRLREAHKLCVVYSSKAIEQEYLAYFEFLKSKKYIGQHVEFLELEELQGASGIKALRVDINHNLKTAEKTFTVSDLKLAQ